jgi:leucyl/phenylalanyl-tRNA---protein transferase
VRHLPDGGSGRRSSLVLDRAAASRHPATEWVPRPQTPEADFEAVIAGCGSERAGRDTTWINAKIRKLYGDLYDMGYCHTVETWRDGRLVGGLYGVALEGAFFGESMFSYESDASKVALVHLLARLVAGKYSLLDCQFVTDHLRQFGTTEVDRKQFHVLLEGALRVPGDFLALPKNANGNEALAAIEGRASAPID